MGVPTTRSWGVRIACRAEVVVELALSDCSGASVCAASGGGGRVRLGSEVEPEQPEIQLATVRVANTVKRCFQRLIPSVSAHFLASSGQLKAAGRD